MRWSIIGIAAFVLMTGCSPKNLRIGGMICPPGHTQEMVHRDFSECRVYDEKAADRASRVKVPEECLECLTHRGYEIDGE